MRATLLPDPTLPPPDPVTTAPPAPPRRLGPRPLPLHLATQGWTFLTSCAASLRLSSAWPTSSPAAPEAPPSHPAPPPPGEAVAGLLAQLTAPDDRRRFIAALDAEARLRFDAFLRGVQAYRDHPYHRPLTDPPVLWRRGTTAVRDYRGTAEPSRHGEGKGAAVLVVPSLVNRCYVLDLTARRSFMRYLARRGFQPFLVDWDAPGPAERRFGLGDYVTDRLEPALDRVREASGRDRVGVVGYCMGGTIALPLAQRRPDAVAALVTLAAPWDFHAGSRRQQRVMAALGEALETVIDLHDELPLDLLQALFASLEPGMIPRKFRAFAAMRRDSARAREFVALEDWLNDGVPLTAAVARETLFGWYDDNLPGRGLWRIAGETVTPEAIAAPMLAVIPSRDRIVPPESALALAARCPQAQALRVPLGHVGMMTGRHAGREVYQPLARWLGKRLAVP